MAQTDTTSIWPGYHSQNAEITHLLKDTKQTSFFNNSWWIHEPLEDKEESNVPLILKMSKNGVKSSKDSLTLSEGAKGHSSRALWDGAVAKDYDRKHDSDCLSSLLAMLRSWRYSLSLKIGCIAQLVFVGGQQFLYVTLRWISPAWDICTCHAVPLTCHAVIVSILSPTLPS